MMIFLGPRFWVTILLFFFQIQNKKNIKQLAFLVSSECVMSPELTKQCSFCSHLCLLLSFFPSSESLFMHTDIASLSLSSTRGLLRL